MPLNLTSDESLIKKSTTTDLENSPLMSLIIKSTKPIEWCFPKEHRSTLVGMPLEKFNVISGWDVALLMFSCDVPFKEVCALYDKSSDKLKAISADNVRGLMLVQSISFEQVCALYDMSQVTLNEMASDGVRGLSPELFQARFQVELLQQLKEKVEASSVQSWAQWAVSPCVYL